MYTCTVDTPLGAMIACAQQDALMGLWFIEEQRFLPDHSGWTESDAPVFAALRAWLRAYFAGRKPDATPCLHPQGSDFRRVVWDTLLRIPYGHTTTYGELADTLRKHGAAQAVGGAVGHNPISLIIPCHRVVGAKGRLTGYGGGLERKKALLALERWARFE
jgi:methylated-DNA-[protein]-cysteine S-methyltransferase